MNNNFSQSLQHRHTHTQIKLKMSFDAYVELTVRQIETFSKLQKVIHEKVSWGKEV